VVVIPARWRCGFKTSPQNCVQSLHEIALKILRKHSMGDRSACQGQSFFRASGDYGANAGLIEVGNGGSRAVLSLGEG
jgi:hypothetical protein